MLKVTICPFGSLILALALSGCGGGSGGNADPAPPAPPPPDYAALAQTAGLSGRYWVDPTALPSYQRQVELRWTDVFSDELGYRVEVQQADGQWAEAGQRPATSGSGQAMTLSLFSWTPARVVALLPGQTQVLSTLGKAQALPSPAGPGVDLGLSAQALPGAIQLGLAQPEPAPAALSLELDGKPIPLNAPSYSQVWDTRAVADGRYAYTLTRQIDTDRRFEERSRLTVANRNPSAVVKFQAQGQLVGVDIDILRWEKPVTDYPRLFVDGVEVIEPVRVGCMGSSRCLRAGGRNLEGLFVDIYNYPSGPHEVAVRMESSDGSVLELRSTLNFDRPPQITFNGGDIDGLVVGDRLRLQGEIRDDQSAVSWQLLVDGQQRASGSSGSLDVDLDLSGLPAGPLQLSLRAVDGAGQLRQLDRTLFVERHAQVQRLPGILGIEGIFASASDAMLLSSWADARPVWWRAGQATQVLPKEVFDLGVEPSSWQLGSGHVYGIAKEPYGYGKPWYAWDTHLQRRELSALSGRSFAPMLSEEIGVLALGPWVAAIAGDSHLLDDRIYVRNEVAGQSWVFSRVGTGSRDNSGAKMVRGGLALRPDGVRVVWCEGQRLVMADSASGSSKGRELAADGCAMARTDGESVAWAGSGLWLGTPPAAFTRVAPAAGNELMRFRMGQGLLAWDERAADGRTRVQVLRGGQTSLVAEGGTLLDAAAHRVLYSDALGRLMLWTAAKGARPLFTAGAGHARLDGDWLSFSARTPQSNANYGGGHYAYRLDLRLLD